MPSSSSSSPTRSSSNKMLRSSASPATATATSPYYYSNGHHHHHHHNHNQHQQQLAALFPSIALCTSCKNSPSAPTLDLLLLLLALSSSAFLIASSARSLSLLLLPYLPSSPPPISLPDAPVPYIAAGFFLVFAFAFGAGFVGLSCRRPSRRARRCGNPRCRGLKKALEFDVQLQTEDCIRSPPDPAQAAMWREIDDLPWKGGQQGNNPDYECLRAELRKMAPPNGRAVLLFRARCGCPLAKLEAWGPKRGRRQKKSMNLALGGVR